MSDVHLVRPKEGLQVPLQVAAWLEGTWVLGSHHNLNLFAMKPDSAASWVLQSFTLDKDGTVTIDYDLEFLPNPSPVMSPSPTNDTKNPTLSSPSGTWRKISNSSSGARGKGATNKSQSDAPLLEMGTLSSQGREMDSEDPQSGTDRIVESVPTTLLDQSSGLSLTPDQRPLARSLDSAAAVPTLTRTASPPDTASEVADDSHMYSTLHTLVPELSQARDDRVLAHEILEQLEIAAEESGQISDSDFSRFTRDLLQAPGSVRSRGTKGEAHASQRAPSRSNQYQSSNQDALVPLLDADSGSAFNVEHRYSSLPPAPQASTDEAIFDPVSRVDVATVPVLPTMDSLDTFSVISGTESSTSILSVAPNGYLPTTNTSEPKLQASVSGTWRVELAATTSLRAILKQHLATLRESEAKNQRAGPIPMSPSSSSASPSVSDLATALSPPGRSSSGRNVAKSTITWKAMSRYRAFILYLDVDVMGVPMSFALLLRLRSGIKRRRKSLTNSRKQSEASRSMFHNWFRGKSESVQKREPTIPFIKPHEKDILTVRLLYAVRVPRVDAVEEPEPVSCLIPADELPNIQSDAAKFYLNPVQQAPVRAISVSELPNPWDASDPQLRSVVAFEPGQTYSTASSVPPTTDAGRSQSKFGCCGCGRSEEQAAAAGAGGPIAPRPKSREGCWCGPARRLPPRLRNSHRLNVKSASHEQQGVTVVTVGSNSEGTRRDAKTKMEWAPGSLVDESSDEEEEEEGKAKEEDKRGASVGDGENLSLEERRQLSPRREVATSNGSVELVYVPTRHHAHFVRFFT